MPATITLLATFAAAYIGGGAFVATAVFYGVSAAIYAGISIGLTAISRALLNPAQQQTRRPEDVQSSIRQPAQARSRHYGRVKISGPWVFGDSAYGYFYKVLALGQGPIDSIEEYWIDDEQVTLDGPSGIVTSGSKAGYAQIGTRLGGAAETYYSGLSATFPEWTSAHRGDGVASLLAVQYPVASENLFEVFSNGINTSYRVVVKGAQILNPVAGTTGWNDNAAAIILDYMKHADGMRLPESIFETTLAQAGWEAAYLRAAEAVPLKAGGTAPRYRLWGSYLLNERPAEVLGRMMQSCDARLYPTADGGLTLDIGDWYEPTVILDEDAIVGFSEVSRGRDVLSSANTITATYLGVDQDYQTADADPWADDVDIAARGEISVDTSFIMAPSHSQCRRLMKLTAYRANPTWVGTFQCNMRGLAALGERFIRITYPQFDIDEVCEVQDFRFLVGEGGLLQGAQIQVISLPSEAYDWVAADEEGDAPARTETVVDRTIPDPENFSVAIRRKTIAGTQVPFAVLTFDAPPVLSLKVEAQGRRTADAQWIPIGVQSGAIEAESFALSDGEEYSFQVRHVTASHRQGDWTDIVAITPVADETAPAVVTGAGGTGGVGQVVLAWTNPNSANFYAVNVRRHTANVEGSATLVRTEYGAPSTVDGWTDSIAAGTYYYWLKARNPSGVESASVATGAVTAT